MVNHDLEKSGKYGKKKSKKDGSSVSIQGSSSPKMTEEEMILAATQENAEMAKAGVINPEYRGNLNIIQDMMNPLSAGVNVEEISESIANVTPTGTKGSSSSKDELNRSALERDIMKGAAAVGVIIEEAYVDDLVAIANLKECLTELDVWMYFRGVARCGQVALTNTMTKLVAQMENALGKCSETIIANAESNKQMVTKQNTISNKIEGVTSTLSNVINQRTDLVLHAVNGIRAMNVSTPPLMPAQSIPPAVPKVVVGGTSGTVNFPGVEDLTRMCDAMKMTKGKGKEINDKYPGKITWDEYNSVVSGKCSKEQFVKILQSLKNRK
ncbi:TPA_asm: P [Celery gammacytorhabdovirus 1]|nr:TPA_asm: P [Celery gammacytorhabdovirus 1]